jgi:hypothetical protein
MCALTVLCCRFGARQVGVPPPSTTTAALLRSLAPPQCRLVVTELRDDILSAVTRGLHQSNSQGTSIIEMHVPHSNWLILAQELQEVGTVARSVTAKQVSMRLAACYIIAQLLCV